MYVDIATCPSPSNPQLSNLSIVNYVKECLTELSSVTIVRSATKGKPEAANTKWKGRIADHGVKITEPSEQKERKVKSGKATGRNMKKNDIYFY